MPHVAKYICVSFVIFIINLPFGFFRVRFKRFTRPWGRCIYIPILINIFIRYVILDWDWTAIPYFASAAILGHILGGLWGTHHQNKQAVSAELNSED